MDYCSKCGRPHEVGKDWAWRMWQAAYNWGAATSGHGNRRKAFEDWWASELREAQRRLRSQQGAKTEPQKSLF